MEKINNDIYDITQTVQDLENRYIDEEDSETLAVGLYGYFGDIHSLILQNDIITTGELGNELFPSRAKFEKNVITHSIIQKIEYINAIPSTIKAMFGIFEEDIQKYQTVNANGSKTFVIDKDIAIPVGSYEFHLEYDIIITESQLPNGKYAYTARYDMSRENPLSQISNPYLNAPFSQLYNGKKMIFFFVEFMQVSHVNFNKTLITNSLVENKTVIFTFEDQLADFSVRITSGDDEVIWLEPVFEGMGVEQNLKDFCYYNYIDASHIRVRFDSISYVPKINDKIDIFIKTTKGAEGNFKYDNTIFPIIGSDNYSYKNLPVYIQFATEASGGKDRKSIDELRKMLPKEALSRGSVTCWQDLENYFNMLNTDQNRLIIQKRVDNQFERSYFAYLLLKDAYNNVIPTNTIDIDIRKEDFDTHDNKKFAIKPGCIIKFDPGTNKGTVLTTDNTDPDKLQKLLNEDKNNFIYTSPMMVVVTGDPLYVSYYMTLIDMAPMLDFSYINPNARIQFIATYVTWVRKYLTEPDTYTFNIAIAENVDSGDSLIQIDENNKIVSNKVRVFLVFYNDDNSNVPYAYTEVPFSEVGSSGQYNFKFKLKTHDKIDDHNKIYVEGLTRAGSMPTDDSPAMLLTPHVAARIYVLADFNDASGGVFGRYDIDSIVPEGLDDFTVCNMYTVQDGLKLYENYTEIISSQAEAISVPGIYTEHSGFHIKRVPCIRKSYVDNEENMTAFVQELQYKKAYIDHALYLLEDNFLIDFKFFNTYGPSRTYTLDRAGTKPINRINLSLHFNLRLLQSSDNNTKNYILEDIKEMIEDLNDISTLHIPNLITTITNKYKESIEFIEFVSFNEIWQDSVNENGETISTQIDPGYGPGIQHLYRQEYNVLTGTQDVDTIPEFLTVHTELNMTPDITISLE